MVCCSVVCDMKRFGVVWCCLASSGAVRCGGVWYGVEWCVLDWFGVVWYGVV